MLTHYIVGYSLCTLFSLSLYGCCSSDKALNEKSGVVTGLVEQVLHHGAYNPDGPNQTVTPLRRLQITVNSNEGELIASPITDEDGKFHLLLPEGSYVVLTPERNDEYAPAYSPAPERITLTAGDSLHLHFRYSIFAP